MKKRNLLEGKRVLIVDDEPDVLETLEDQLSMCTVSAATGFAEAKELLESRVFDIAVLDIMGVDGYQLLDIAVRREVIPVMLTANALSPQDAAKSFRSGAASYLPKEKMSDIVKFLNDILEAQLEGKSLWWRWFERLGAYYEKRFGANWEATDQSIWDMIKYGA